MQKDLEGDGEMGLRIPHKLSMSEVYTRYLVQSAYSRRICETIYKFVSENKKPWGWGKVGQATCIADKDGLHKYPVDAYYRQITDDVRFY